MKKISLLTLGTIILTGMFSGVTNTFANVDDTSVTGFKYTCDTTKGEGVLVLKFSLSGHHTYTRIYNVNHAGYFTIWDEFHTTVTPAMNLYIPGCGCPPPADSEYLEIRPSGGFNDGFWWGIYDFDTLDKWVFNNGSGHNYTTTVVKLKVANNGGVPLTCTADSSTRHVCISGTPECSLSLTESNLSVQNTSKVMTLRSNQGANIPGGGTVNCAPPKKSPTVVCDTNPQLPIPVVNNSFTLPAEIMQTPGKCSVTFSGEDSCYGDYSETIKIKTEPTVTVLPPPGVCFLLTDEFGKPYTGNIEKFDLTTLRNTYLLTPLASQNFTGKVVHIANNKYCLYEPTPDTPTGNNTPPGGKGNTPNGSGSTPPGNGDFLPPGSTISKITFNGYGDPHSQPGGFKIGGDATNADPHSQPGGLVDKPCRAKIQVKVGETWTDNGVLYNELQDYRIQILDEDMSNPACQNGEFAIIPGSVSATGGTLSGGVIMAPSGTFSAYIRQPNDALPTHPRGLIMKVSYKPSYNNKFNYRYIINAKSDDFSSPLEITGNTGKGVRIIGAGGASAGGQFNADTTGLILADNSTTVTSARSAIMRNVALLTRNITSDQATQQIYYATKNVSYSSLKSKIPDTLIVRGGDLTIDENIDTSIGIIVLKDDNGVGGNIHINNNVTRVNANIYADGIVSGTNTPRKVEEGALQLVLVGSLFSSNTIGTGATDSDLNNLRNANSGRTEYKGYYDPFIIEQKAGNHAGFVNQ